MALNCSRRLLNNQSILHTISRHSSGQATRHPAQVFDKRLRAKHADASAADPDAHLYDYIKDHVAKDVCDRIEDLLMPEKLRVLSIGSCSGLIIKNINPDQVRHFTQGDISSGCLERCRQLNQVFPPRFPIHYVQCDEESLPFKHKSADLVVSCLNMHWVDDLVSSFKQVHATLDENSPFIGAMFGGDTLYELRSSLQTAEIERLSKFSSHVAPKTTGQDVARLLQATGFKLITVDLSEIKIVYPTMFELMFDLQGMGENNASLNGSWHLYQDILPSAAAIYQSMYGSDDIEKGVPATFQIIHFIGWKNPKKATPLRSATER